MAQLLAIEWDSSEARVAVARGGGDRIMIEQAFAVDLSPRSTSSEAIETNVGERLTSALSARGISGRVETLVAVGRANIELRVLNIPPVPDDELPDLVRFQALQQFTAVGEDWPLDYVVLDHDEEGANVLAAALSPELVEQITQSCETAGVTAKRLVLRPFAAASLLRSQGVSGQCRMMVDLLADEVDLTVLVDQQVVFMRTVRRPTADDVEQANRALIGEIRRTMVAAQNQLGGRRVDGIVVCGVADDHSALKSQIEQQLSLDTQLLNPFEGVRLGRELERSPPDHPGRFAPLLGMLLDEASGTAHTIDFLNPRRRPEPESNLRSNLLVASVCVVALILMGWFSWPMLFGEDPEVQRLREEHARLQKDEAYARELIRRAEEIDHWSDGDVKWLDELREISEKLPPAQDVVVTRMTLRALRSGGRMSMDAVAKDSAVIEQVGKTIADDRHSSKGDGPWPSQLIDGYEREFRETVTVTKHQPPAEEKPVEVADKEADK